MRLVRIGLVVCLVGAVVSAAVPLTTWLLEGWRTERAQAAMVRRIPQAPSTGSAGRSARVPVAAPADAGAPLALMQVPVFGEDWEWVVVEGTEPDDLVSGPGHYVGTPLPGARGNVALAGHRAGHGDPFLDFDRLRAGDEVRLSQGATTWVYEIDGAPEIVEATATHVLDPLPGRRLTLTTCWPKWGSSKRMVVTSTLRTVVRGGVSTPVGSPARAQGAS